MKTGGKRRSVSRIHRSTYFKLVWTASNAISPFWKHKGSSKSSSISYRHISWISGWRAIAKQKQWMVLAPVSWPYVPITQNYKQKASNKYFICLKIKVLDYPKYHGIHFLNYLIISHSSIYQLIQNAPKWWLIRIINLFLHRVSTFLEYLLSVLCYSLKCIKNPGKNLLFFADHYTQLIYSAYPFCKLKHFL